MFPSGSTRPDQPNATASNDPASALFSSVVNSVGSSVTLKPAFSSIDWITWPRRALTVSLPSIRRTLIGVCTPDALTSFFASATLACLLHWRPLVVVYHGLTGEIG